MFCEELSEDEIYQAYLIYASLNGLDTDEDAIRTRITDYFKHHQPDELIDDAILAYAEDCIVAPPDVVVAKWGSSRFYELERFPCSVARHQTCESWFENGCRFVSEEHTPRLVHFWTSFDIEGAIASTRHPGTGLAGDLQSGTRLSLVLESNGAVSVVHRTRGLVGCLPTALSNSLHQVPLRDRKYLALVDKVEPAQQIFGSKPAETRVHVSAENRRPGCQLLVTCQLLVMCGAPDVSKDELVSYAAEAFLADRNKC